MSSNDILKEVAPEVLLTWARADINKALSAQADNKPFPELGFLALLLKEGAFDKVPPSIWRQLGNLLQQDFKPVQGRPQKKQKYIAVAEEYAHLKTNGVGYNNRIKILREAYGYSSESSVLKAVKIGEEHLEKEPKDEHGKRIINFFAYALAQSKKDIVSVDNKPTDKKD